MDCRAVLIFLCLLISQAACVPVTDGPNTGALRRSMLVMREEIQTALHHLYPQKDAPGVPPNITCFSPNIMEQVGSEQKPLTAYNLACFRCYILNISLSELTPELSEDLGTISEYTKQVERLMSGQKVSLGCQLPTFEHDADKYEYLRCLLQLLDQRLKEAKF